MKNINLQQISYFRTVMKCSSFSKAAELSFTTQSTISKTISSLETTIGEPLFIRTKNGVFPTQRAIILNLELAEFYDKVESLFSTQSVSINTYKIGFCQNIDFHSCLPQLFSILNDYEKPELEISLSCLENETIVNNVINGSLDLGFILSDTNVSNPYIKLCNILSGQPKIFFSIFSELAKKQNLSISDFAEYPIVTTKFLIEKNDYRLINALPFTPKSIKIVDTYDDIPIYLATGKYITLLRPFVNLAYCKDITSFELSTSYNITQGITMIWSEKNNHQIHNHIIKTIKRKLTNME